MQMPSDYIPINLHHLRKQRGWTFNRTACSTGISKTILRRIEAGYVSPTSQTLQKIAAGFNVPPHRLLTPGDIGE